MAITWMVDGKVWIPDSIREYLGLMPGEPLLLTSGNGEIVLSRVRPLPSSLPHIHSSAERAKLPEHRAAQRSAQGGTALPFRAAEQAPSSPGYSK